MVVVVVVTVVVVLVLVLPPLLLMPTRGGQPAGYSGSYIRSCRSSICAARSYFCCWLHTRARWPSSVAVIGWLSPHSVSETCRASA